jgi:hypothetical protein
MQSQVITVSCREFKFFYKSLREHYFTQQLTTKECQKIKKNLRSMLIFKCKGVTAMDLSTHYNLCG